MLKILRILCLIFLYFNQIGSFQARSFLEKRLTDIAFNNGKQVVSTKSTLSSMFNNNKKNESPFPDLIALSNYLKILIDAKEFQMKKFNSGFWYFRQG